jgi:hypothetical protein
LWCEVVALVWFDGCICLLVLRRGYGLIGLKLLPAAFPRELNGFFHDVGPTLHLVGLKPRMADRTSA